MMLIDCEEVQCVKILQRAKLEEKYTWIVKHV